MAETSARDGSSVGPGPNRSIPPMDWDRAPWNRWSFLNMREVLPTVEVWRGFSPARPLATAEDMLPYSAVWLPGNDNPALRRFLSLARSLASGRPAPDAPKWVS